MRILLVSPPYLGVFTFFGLRIPPMGLGYIPAAVREAGHEVRILDLRHKNLSRWQLEMGLGLSHLAFYLRSWKAVMGFFKFLWVRRKGLGSLRETTHELIG